MADTPEKIIIKVELEGIEESKKALQSTKDATMRLSQGTKELQAELKKVGLEHGKGADAYKKLSEQIEINQTKIRQNQRAQFEYAAAIRDTSQRQKEAAQASKEAAKANEPLDGSLNALRRRLSEVVKERNALNSADKEGAARYAELTREGKSLNEELKKEEGAIGDNRRGVGGYADAIRSVLGAQGDLIGQLRGLQDQLIGLRSGLEKIVGGLKGVKAAVIGTGIGALIVLLGALVAAFSATEDGANAIGDSMAGLKIGFKNLLFGIDDFRKKAATALGNFFENIKQPFKEFGTLLEGLFIFDKAKIESGLAGIKTSTDKLFSDLKKDAGAALGAIGDAFEKGFEAVGDSVKLRETLREIEKAKIALSVQNAKDLVQLERLKKVGDDVSKSEKERVGARVEANELLANATAKETALTERELAATTALNKLTGQNMETRQAEADLSIKISSLKSRQLSEEQDGLNAIANIQREAYNAQLGRISSLATAAQNLTALKNKGGEDALKREIERLGLLLDNENLATGEQIANIQKIGIAEKDLIALQTDGQTNVLEASMATIEAKQKLQEEAALKGITISQEERDALVQQEELYQGQLTQLRDGAAIRYAKITAKTQKEVVAITEKTAKAERKITKLTGDQKLSVASDVIGNLSTLAGENFEAQKAFQLAGAIVDGIRGVMGTYAALAPANPIVAAVAAAAAGVAAAVNIVKIIQTKPTGGGGGGSASVGDLGSAATNSRTASATLAQGASSDNLAANQLANTLGKMPAPVVSVVDINNAQNRVATKDAVRKL